MKPSWLEQTIAPEDDSGCEEEDDEAKGGAGNDPAPPLSKRRIILIVAVFHSSQFILSFPQSSIATPWRCPTTAA